MDAQIEQLGQVLLITLGCFLLVVLAVLVYVFWLVIELHKDVRRYLRHPEVERDAGGRRIRERL